MDDLKFTKTEFSWGPMKVVRLYSDAVGGMSIFVQGAKEGCEIRVSPKGNVFMVYPRQESILVDD